VTQVIELVQLEAWIAELGSTIEEISATLRAAEVTGYRRMAGRCPIAMYLARKAGQTVSVGTGGATIYQETDTIRASFPIEVERWIMRFDNGEFPEFDAMIRTEQEV
jgi:hypothetical protein